MMKTPYQKIPVLLERIATNFRRGEYGQANQQMVKVIGFIEDNLQRVDPASIPLIEKSVSEAFMAQQGNDLLYLADILEYELLPLFPQSGNSE